MTADDEIKSSVASRILSHGGRILEIGTGPGGGFMPAILKHDPDASVTISDLSPTVVRQWKHFLDRTLHSPNLSYAVFNFCDIPFRDESFDVVSDGGGIGNTEQGSRASALREVYRILKPDGILVTSTGFVTRETLAALPESAQSVLKEKRPDIFEDLYEDTVLAGFSRIESFICGGWDTDGDDSTIADLARSLGVNLHFTSYIRFCFK
ncbi:MAG: class I SAM-dependent methyltransferase [Clostridia bacterium]|nr:class I SAM-dependent methyltransferase [Clostridia bacterium]